MTTDPRPNAMERSPLTASATIDAALALAAAEGLAAVSIRRLARQLGVTPMALYWHIRDKEDLLDGMAARILEAVDLSLAADAGWRDQLRTVLGRLLAVLRAHPAAASLIATRTVSSEGGLRTTETLLDILRRGGFSPSQATQVARHTVSTLSSLVSGEPGTVGRDESPKQREGRRQARATLGNLPPDRYPRLIEAAAPLSEPMDLDAYFAFALDLLLAGIETMAARATPT